MGEEVPLAVRTFNDAALVRFALFATGQQQLFLLAEGASNLPVALCHDVAPYAVPVLAENEVVVAVVEEELVGFAPVSGVYQAGAFSVNASSVLRHAKEVGLVAVGKPRAYKPALSLLVPNGRAVVPSALLQQGCERLPRSFGLWCGGHEETLVGRAEEEEESSVVIAQRACPDAPPVAVHLFPGEGVTDLRQVCDSIAGNLPVYQVLGVKYRHSGRELHGGRDGIVVVAYADAVEVAVVGRDDGIAVGAVGLFAPRLPVAPADSGLCFQKQ